MSKDVDQTKSISQMSSEELVKLCYELDILAQVEDQIKKLARDAGNKDLEVNTTTKIGDMYSASPLYSSKTLSELTFDELNELNSRLYQEIRVHDLIKSLNFNLSGQYDPYPPKIEIDNSVPVKTLYHSGMFSKDISSIKDSGSKQVKSILLKTGNIIIKR
jgi:hypothetical protein